VIGLTQSLDVQNDDGGMSFRSDFLAETFNGINTSDNSNLEDTGDKHC